MGRFVKPVIIHKLKKKHDPYFLHCFIGGKKKNVLLEFSTPIKKEHLDTL